VNEEVQHDWRCSHKIFHSIKQINKSIIPSHRQCVNLKFKPILDRIKTYSCSFFPSAVDLWNQMPASVTNIHDIVNIKTDFSYYNLHFYRKTWCLVPTLWYLWFTIGMMMQATPVMQVTPSHDTKKKTEIKKDRNQRN